MQHHLAVLYRTFIDAILAGRKTVECRLGRWGRPPHGLVKMGDLIWLKQVSGPVRAAVRVAEVHTIPLVSATDLRLVQRDWNDRVGAPAAFWQRGRSASVATLIGLGDVCGFGPDGFKIIKRDRRAWVLLASPPVPGRPLRVNLRSPPSVPGSNVAAREALGS